MIMWGLNVPAAPAFDPRTIDGTNNNLDHPSWGRTDSQLLRLANPDYGDEIASPAGSNRPSPREISNIVSRQIGHTVNEKYATDYLWQWGQFIDHDMDLTEGAHQPESFPISIPAGDPFFDPAGTGTQVMPFHRSIYDVLTGTTLGNPRQQTNQLTAFLDASMVYGSDPVRAAALRTNDGTGRLKTGAGHLLPFNVNGLPNAGGPDPSLFLAGDIRANEQVGLTVMHTLFVREHNRLARHIRKHHPNFTDDEIYERARRLVGAMIQVITYKEFLPVLLGPDALSPYTGYKSDTNPGISNLFSTAAFRLGHSLLSPELLRLKRNGKPIKAGNLPLREAFFAPWRITDEGGIAPILRGLAAQPAQELDAHIVDDVRNFLFGPPGAGGFDLASLNIQRGRDHGLPSYNDARIALNLAPATSFTDIASNADLRERLAQAYGTVEAVDVWVGGLAEDHVPGAMVGELFNRILRDQFQRLRDGDRYWYQNVFSARTIRKLERTTLADIIRRNTEIRNEIQDNVFVLASHKKAKHHKHDKDDDDDPWDD